MVDILSSFEGKSGAVSLGMHSTSRCWYVVLHWADRGSILTRVKDQAIRRIASVGRLGGLKSIRCWPGRKSLFSGGHGNLSFCSWEGGGYSISLWPFSLPANSMLLHPLPHSHKVPNSAKSASQTQWIRRGYNITWPGIPVRFILPSPFVFCTFNNIIDKRLSPLPLLFQRDAARTAS